ncbi:MAG: type II toxin-antitoxin system HicB family antitoxin [Chloroflexi bacterium]|nr:type II toxin-antitoxin system HicB family antitoxin [Chloroflexota bacterium]
MRQPYRIVVQANPDEGGYVASVRELPNCIAAGETIEETVELLREAMEAWFLVALEHGRPLPEPMADEAGYSDQLRVRLPERLHRELAEQAAREGMSLNTLIVSYLAREAGVHPGGD